MWRIERWPCMRACSRLAGEILAQSNWKNEDFPPPPLGDADGKRWGFAPNPLPGAEEGGSTVCCRMLLLAIVQGEAGAWGLHMCQLVNPPPPPDRIKEQDFFLPEKGVLRRRTERCVAQKKLCSRDLAPPSLSLSFDLFISSSRFFSQTSKGPRLARLLICWKQSKNFFFCPNRMSIGFVSRTQKSTLPILKWLWGCFSSKLEVE